MNVGLKALLSVVFDALILTEDALAKKGILQLLPDIFPLLADLISSVASIPDLQSEIGALPGSAQEADLVAYIQSKFGSVLPPGKAKSILAASLKLVTDVVQDSLALEAAITS